MELEVCVCLVFFKHTFWAFGICAVWVHGEASTIYSQFCCFGRETGLAGQKRVIRIRIQASAWEQHLSVLGFWLHQLQAGHPQASSLPFLGLVAEAYTQPTAAELKKGRSNKKKKDEAYKSAAYAELDEWMRAVTMLAL